MVVCCIKFVIIFIFPFPNPQQKDILCIFYDIWHGNNALLNLQPQQGFKQCRICQIHFNTENIMQSKLQQIAVPKLHLPGK